MSTKKNVLRLQVSVNDSFRMGRFHRACHLIHHVEGLLDRQPPPSLLEHLIQIRTVEELDHEERQAARQPAHVLDSHDVGRLDGHRCPRFVRETLHHTRVAPIVIVEHLESHAPHRFEVSGLEDPRRATDGDLP